MSETTFKVYINETPLILTADNQFLIERGDPNKNLFIRYNGKARSLMNPIDMLEKTQRLDSVIVYHNDAQKLKKDFESLFKILEAGGGIVTNPNKEILTMFRLKTWDLPKGKIDKGETKEAAAIREVQEETGLNQVELGDFLLETNHTYKNRKGKRIIKRTYWYQMSTTENDIRPEIEEDIESVAWMTPELFLEQKPLYNTIKEVVLTYLKDSV